MHHQRRAAPGRVRAHATASQGQRPMTPPPPTLSRRLAAEAIGTGLLLATVVGSGIMAERLAEGNGALALLCNALATGAGLVALI